VILAPYTRKPDLGKGTSYQGRCSGERAHVVDGDTVKIQVCVDVVTATAACGSVHEHVRPGT
jgi:hypothetical protein